MRVSARSPLHPREVENRADTDVVVVEDVFNRHNILDVDVSVSQNIDLLDVESNVDQAASGDGLSSGNMVKFRIRKFHDFTQFRHVVLLF